MRSKYNARKVYVNGQRYDSEKEYMRFNMLLMMQKSGEIRDLKRQVRFEVIPKRGKNRAAYYVADFTYYTNDGRYVVEDAKGVKTDVYRIKKKLLYWERGIDILET